MELEKMLASTLVRDYAGPLGIMAWSVPHVVLQVYAHVFAGGSFMELMRDVGKGVVWETVKAEVQARGWESLKMLAFFMVLQTILLVYLPGKEYDGPRTVTGHVPKYRDTGLRAYIITIVLMLGIHRLGLYNLATVHDNFLATIVILNIFALCFCVFLYVKGRVAPSSTDNRIDDVFVADYYRGIELYPRIGTNFDIKMFTNCRMGMMGWPLLCIAFAAKQKELYGEVTNTMWISMILQVIYCYKFFLWERGYMGTVDIMHDRGGYYICWGCLCFLPSTYTAHTLFLVKHPHNYSPLVSYLVFALGFASIWINYWADYQRQVVRATGAKCTIWGQEPKVIRAQYTETSAGKTAKKTNLLLASGFWGISRHFHYVPEILAAFFWSAPMLHGLVLPYFYVIFLTILLFDRATRDDRKCFQKYGPYWKEYCELVPYRIIPYVF
eukprot:Plantae.Rhodophyta-Purpureofilum_apyrenoidigerum.ctg30004.p1 GENE.Plantae.Rhodophyta-Purpureofilum_apyrenoidigerum.ctg30004~~Plantae.Rhodophyta-Purpureofilum_apyrenoidigerum.ctg30004.p1  ORF type:complete len:465 (+),score=60.99 Plantae.Rhodophyta-Purpureofilum_apyrenoidigerum.ctg30004:78-1397(+)